MLNNQQIKQLELIAEKCEMSHNFDNMMIHEGSVKQLLSEDVDQSDLDSINKSIDIVRGDLDKVEKYFEELKIKERLEKTMNFHSQIRKTLEKAQMTIVEVSLETGALVSFYNKNVTVARMTSAIIYLIGKVQTYILGFEKAIDRIKKNLLPMIKDADVEQKKKSIRKNIELKGFDISSIEKKLVKLFNVSFENTILGSISNFFKKPWVGDSAKLINTVDFSSEALNIVSVEIAGSLLKFVSVEAFLAIELQDVQQSPDLDDAAENADQPPRNEPPQGGLRPSGDEEAKKKEFRDKVKKVRDEIFPKPENETPEQLAARKKEFKDALKAAGLISESKKHPDQLIFENWQSLAGLLK